MVKMLLISSLAILFLIVGSDQGFSTITVPVGQDVTLKCNCADKYGDLYWTLMTADNIPKFLISADSYARTRNNLPRISAERKDQSFDLHLSRVDSGDSGIYFCSEVWNSQMTFLNATFLQVQDAEPSIIHVVQPDLPNSNLECSLFTNPKNKTCSDRESVYWFKSKADDSPSVLLAHDYGGDSCEQSSESRKCFYNMPRDEKSSDTRRLHCAVVSCGHIFIGNGSEIRKSEGEMTCSYIVVVLAPALAFSVGVNGLLIYIIWKRKRNFETSSNVQPTSTIDEQQVDNSECLVYAAPIYNARKKGRRNTSSQENVIYSGVRVTG